jgi:two-component system nitrate/nitrite response regulator NarL
MSNQMITSQTKLTIREREIAQLATRGLANKAIARELSLCEGTVKLHFHHIFQKLGVRNRTALMIALSCHTADDFDERSQRHSEP